MASPFVGVIEESKIRILQELPFLGGGWSDCSSDNSVNTDTDFIFRPTRQCVNRATQVVRVVTMMQTCLLRHFSRPLVVRARINRRRSGARDS